MSQASRLRALEAEGSLHPRADAVTAALFAEGGFFFAADKVQVKYEMLRSLVGSEMCIRDRLDTRHGGS